jgi:hypothetical protein
MPDRAFLDQCRNVIAACRDPIEAMPYDRQRALDESAERLSRKAYGFISKWTTPRVEL